MTTKRSLAGRALLAAAALALVGCGAQPFPQSEVRTTPTTLAPVPATPMARLLASAQRTTAAKSARVALHMTIGGAAEDGLTIDGAGSADLSGQTVDLKLRTNSDQSGEGTGEIRIVNRVAYVEQDGTWERLPLDGSFATATVPDPTSYLDFLQGVADDVRVDGHEPLRGVDTTRYFATVDLNRALARSVTSAARRAVVANAHALFGGLRMPVTVWIDAQGRLRKLNLTMDLSGVAAKLGVSATAKIEVTIEFYDFGVPVTVAIPAGAVDARVLADDRAAQSDLRNALTAEKTVYTDNRQYSAAASEMKQIEPSLDWGGKLTFVVGPSGFGPNGTVCLSERSASGKTFLIADVAEGAGAGTRFGTVACPATVTQATLSTFGSSW